MRRPQDIDVRQQPALSATDVASGEQPQSAGRSAVAQVFGLVVAIVGLDQITKWWAVDNLEVSCAEPEACIDIFWTLRLHLHFNPGASFGAGASLGPLIGFISWIMAGAMIWFSLRPRPTLPRWVYAAIAGGAIGNGVDRLFRADEGIMSGKVVDFIDFQWWPIFNVADSAIVVAVVVALVGSFFASDPGGADSVAGDSVGDAGSGEADDGGDQLQDD